MSALSASDRILAACCPESPIDVFTHAAQIVGAVSDAHLRHFKKQSPPPSPAKESGDGLQQGRTVTQWLD